MSKQERESRPPVQAPKRRGGEQRVPWVGLAIAAGVLALLGATFVVPRLFEADSTAAALGGPQATGDGPAIGSLVRFDEREVVSGRAISSNALKGKKTLLFFSEGVMCQACFQQIQGLERIGAQLQERGIQLISITPDTAGDLKQAISQYGIKTPMIFDDGRTMSEVFNTLGQGMHADTSGPCRRAAAHRVPSRRDGTVLRAGCVSCLRQERDAAPVPGRDRRAAPA